LSDFKKAINADVPKSINIEIKQEEFELAESYQLNKNLQLIRSSSKKIREKKRKNLKNSDFLNVKREVQENLQQRTSGISSE
jgi:hypothetical protein